MNYNLLIFIDIHFQIFKMNIDEYFMMYERIHVKSFMKLINVVKKFRKRICSYICFSIIDMKV